MTDVYKLLHSGFIVQDNGDLVQIPRQQKTILSSLIHQSLIRADTNNYYDGAVDQLYSTYNAHPGNGLSDFNFRELVLKKALMVFGDDFKKWFRVQLQSPAFTYLHDRYLKETLLFIYDYKPRSVQHLTNYRLLIAGHDNPTAGLDDPLKAYRDLPGLIEQIPGEKTIDLITQWTRTMEGFQDLVMTMNVVFGRRDAALSNY